MIEKNILKKLYLEEFHINNYAKFNPFAGYNMPISYSNSGIINEHLHTRQNAGLFDVSHMLQISIEIKDSTIKKLEKIIPLDLSNMPYGKSNYSFLLNINGGIIDDIIISKIKNNKEFFYIVLNSSRRKEDLNYINSVINDELIFERKDSSLLAFQGPKSRNILKKIFPEIQNLKFMNIISTKYNNYDVLISCSGYTGEDGFELSIDNKIVNKILNSIMQNEHVKMCGLGSRDTLRLEAGLCLYGNELSENINPVEANLMWSIPNIRKQKKDFLGANKLLDLNNSFSEIRIGLKSTSKAIPRSNLDIFNNQNELIGKITSGSYSPTLQEPIAMGYVKKEFSKINTKVFFKLRNKMENAIVCKLPFISNRYYK